MSLSEPKDARKVLREATHPAHVRLNKHPLLNHLTSPGYPLAHYRKVLTAYFGCYARIEASIDDALRRWPVNFSYAARRKLPWLNADLAWFGIDAPVGRTSALPELIDDQYGLFGVLYAIEGSSLGGRVIGQGLSKHLGLTPAQGARFFAGYGDEIDQRWGEIVALLNDRLTGPAALDSAILSANRTFRLIETALDEHAASLLA
ncbi:MAG: biliverdin-producing heme oxygenase [Azonexaceae bacterium]|nr:biliverdin-producing heme oxygenase [Azonexaceae bacterium]